MSSPVLVWVLIGAVAVTSLAAVSALAVIVWGLRQQLRGDEREH